MNPLKRIIPILVLASVLAPARAQRSGTLTQKTDTVKQAPKPSKERPPLPPPPPPPPMPPRN